MTYATKQLTEGLQRLSESGREFQTAGSKDRQLPAKLELSSEIDLFLKARRDYREKSRPVSVGNY